MLTNSSDFQIRKVGFALLAIAVTLSTAGAAFGQNGEIIVPPGQNGEVELPGRPDVSNPNNPHDEAGRLHNEGLDYAITARNRVGTRLAPLTIAATGRILDLAADSQPAGCAIRQADIERVARFVSADPETRYVLLKESMSEEQLFWTEKIRALLNIDDPESTAADLRALEEDIRATFSTRDAESLLATASIARYSVEYWHRQKRLELESPWYLGDGDPSQIPNIDDNAAAVDALAYKLEYEKADHLGPISRHEYALHMSMLASAGLVLSEAQYW